MKTKPIDPKKKQDFEEDDIEVEASGPAIAAAKKGKVAIIAASTILTVIVFYFFFFKEDNSSKEVLEIVEPPRPENVAPSDSGKPIFAFDENIDKQKNEVDVLEKPSVPEVPSLPELPEDAISPESINLNNPSVNNDIKPNGGLPLDQALLPSQEIPQNQIQVQNPDGTISSVASQQKDPVNPRYAPIIVFSGGGEGGSASISGVGLGKNIVKLNNNPLEDLQETPSGVVATYISDRPHTIAQGKLLTAILETAINTEVPGSVRAIVSRDVYGEAGNQVLIPKGSRLFGSYTTQIRRGQGRVEIAWIRLIRPDGVDLAINFNASDQFGRSGILGEIDNKYSAIVANSLLTSVIAVAATAAAQNLAGNTNTTTTTNATQGTTTVTADATNQAINNISKSVIDTVGQIVNDALDITPVIRVPQGTRITVIVNSDIKVPFINGRGS